MSLYPKQTPAEPGTVVKFELEPYHYAVPERTLLADLLKVARRLKARAVFPQQYNKLGRFTAATYRNRFGSWEAALRAAHLEPCYPRLVEDEAILADLAQMAKRLGTPTLAREEYFARGRFGTTTISRRFGSWNAAVAAAGLTANPVYSKNPTNEELFENFELVWRSLGRQPRGRDLAPPLSRFGIGTYLKRFRTFRRALHLFVAHQKELGKTDGSRLELPTQIHRKTGRPVGSRMRYRVLQRDNFKCCLCGRSPANDPAVRLQVDHIKPWSAGGETVLDNLQTLCQTCNAGKSNL